MADIFLSYKKEDKERTAMLAEALEGEGFSVYWDPDIPPGKTFDEELETQLKQAASIIVCWTERSVRSEWVRDEAERGRKKGVLFPVFFDPVEPPLGFGRIEGADLIHWEGNRDDAEFQGLVAALRTHTPPPQPSSAAEPPPAPPRRSSGPRVKARALVLGIVLAGAAATAAALYFNFEPVEVHQPIALMGEIRGDDSELKKKLGNPISDGAQFERFHVSFMDKGYLIWMFPEWNFLALSSDTYQAIEIPDAYQPGDTSVQQVVDDRHPERPEGRHAPIGGAYRVWKKLREDKDKPLDLGWETGNCMFLDSVWGQRFEHGRIVGPFPLSFGNYLGVAAVVFEDGTWRLATLSENVKPPQCEAPVDGLKAVPAN